MMSMYNHRTVGHGTMGDFMPLVRQIFYDVEADDLETITIEEDILNINIEPEEEIIITLEETELVADLIEIKEKDIEIEEIDELNINEE
ncbi:MAG: hypothetical protein GY853_16705 [PVC group bacterium]|nr:hypothetical protein [PVC group bacterium]